ncbi:MAG: amino-acid N-acetyltransferase [Planctomycetota bacterium]|jgi:amino-acid N-acetyltransferase
MPTAQVIALQAGQITLLQSLLNKAGLPYDDCLDIGHRYYGVFSGARLIGAGGLELARNDALLRSLVVATDFRSQGLGGLLSDFILAEARRLGQASIYLLTETAGDYFTARGFTLIERDQVPDSIAGTRQFSELCPDSASCMQLILPGQ